MGFQFCDDCDSLALRQLSFGDGAVFCSSLTLVVSANTILYQGARPVFIDAEPLTWDMAPVSLRAMSDAAKQGNLPKAVLSSTCIAKVRVRMEVQRNR